MKGRPLKHPELMQAIHAAIKSGAYRFTEHTLRRLQERDVNKPELIEILLQGWHESAKDMLLEPLKAWNYAIRGKTLEGREIRVIVALQPILLVITVIDLNA
jgi:hypothetical protein